MQITMKNISDSVLRAAQKINKLIAEGAEPHDLTPRQVDVLLILSEESGLSQTDMMDRSFMDRSTMSTVINTMLKKGLITKVRNKDDVRAFKVDLTADGKALIKQAKRLRNEVEGNVVKQVGANEKLHSALMQIAALPLKTVPKKKGEKV